MVFPSWIALYTIQMRHARTRSHLLAVRVIKHAVHDVLGQLSFIGVGGSAHPGVDDALVICALKRYLQKTYVWTEPQELTFLC